MCFQGNALAATIHGTVYEWYSFKPLENSIVEINSTPEQSFVATDAEYSFNLTPGTYLITANYFEEDTIVYTTEEEVIVSDEGEFVHDLLLFPTYQEDLLDQGDFENVDLDFEEAEPQSPASSQNKVSSQNMVLTFALLAICILLLAGYFVKKEKRNPPEKTAGSLGKMGHLNASGLNASELNASELNASELNASEPENLTIKVETSEHAKPNKTGSIEVSETDHELPASLKVEEWTGNISETEMPVQQTVKLAEDSKVSINPSEEEFDSFSPGVEIPEATLPDDLKEIMSLIRANGNRITQRELRKKSPYSESKVSLMLSDLEERGLVEKFKRGRGNIIRIPDGEIIKQGSQSKKESGGNGTL
ncbi:MULTISPECIES: winged helix-turn-helix transcriptional regulator [unclassified Methanosarcina]|uniref:helix-turn-helix transcriptional regulator n=1 Tax=unclassified Methanosarcina TaxID=2644672 RepID=UPI000A73225E|nr:MULTISPECIES: winged helix-turn-helix transcriptional regulator [unclassified Methanosarcina]